MASSIFLQALSVAIFFFNEGQEEVHPQVFQQMEITFPDCPRWSYNYHSSPSC